MKLVPIIVIYYLGKVLDYKMKTLQWRDYDLSLDKEIDSWILPSYSKNAQLINRYAFFNEPASVQYEWYKTHPFEMSNIADYFKVVKLDHMIIALLILNYFKDDNGRLVLGINPIAVNPNLINQGYGTLILSDLIANTKVVTGCEVDVIYAGIDEKNSISTKLFSKFGFKEVGRSEDKEFLYFELNRSIG